MTRASILSLAMLSLLTVSGCEKQSTRTPDESDGAPEEDFAPDEEDIEEEEQAPNLSKRTHQ